MGAASITFAGNRKQQEMFEIVEKSLAYLILANQIFMGGSIRGGKTFCIACMQIFIAMEYPNSIHYVIRASQPNLTSSTIPSFEAVINIILENPKFRNSWKWHRQSGNYYVQYRNGSRIYFRSQNFDNDKDSDWLKGLEVNTIFLEQMEEIEESFYKVAISRVGSKRLKKEPRGLLFGSFNPTQNFVKKLIYEPYKEGALPKNIHFIETRPSDNPYNTEDQKRNWENMDSRTYAQFINGSWDDYDMADGAWLYALKPRVSEIFVGSDKVQLSKVIREVIVSFDFNDRGYTATVAQINNVSIASPHFYIKIIDCIVIGRKDCKDHPLNELCRQVNAKYPQPKKVTGDASGRNTIHNSKESEISCWVIIKANLKNVSTWAHVPTQNKAHTTSRNIFNLVLSNVKNFYVNEDLTELCQEMKTAKVNPKKKDELFKNSTTHLMDKFDTVRYILDNFCFDILNYLHKS